MSLTRKRLWGVLAYAPIALIPVVVVIVLLFQSDDPSKPTPPAASAVALVAVALYGLGLGLSFVHASRRPDLSRKESNGWTLSLWWCGPIGVIAYWQSTIKNLPDSPAEVRLADPAEDMKWRDRVRRGPNWDRMIPWVVLVQWVVAGVYTALFLAFDGKSPDDQGPLLVGFFALLPIAYGSIAVTYGSVRRNEAIRGDLAGWIYWLFAWPPFGTTVYWLRYRPERELADGEPPRSKGSRTTLSR